MRDKIELMRIEVTYIEDPKPKKRLKLHVPKRRAPKPAAAVAHVWATKLVKPAKAAKLAKPAKVPKAKPVKKRSKPPKKLTKPVKPIKTKPTRPVSTGTPKVRIPRPLRNAIISAAVLLVLCVGVGEVYVMFADNGSMPTAAASIQPAASIASSGEIKPSKPAPNIPESAAVEMATSPVAPGAQASVSVHTNAGSTCSIAVIYNFDYEKKQTPVSDPALGEQTADDFGTVAWNWTISPTAALGPGRATVTCTYHGRHAMVIADLLVTK